MTASGCNFHVILKCLSELLRKIIAAILRAMILFSTLKPASKQRAKYSRVVMMIDQQRILKIPSCVRQEETLLGF